MDNGLGQQPDNPVMPPANPIAPQPVSTGLENNSPPQPELLDEPKSKRTMWLITSLVIVVILIIAGIFLIKHNDRKSVTTAKVYKVGILDGLTSYFGGSVTGFEQGMTNLGYIKGKTIIYDVENKPLTGNQATFKKFIANKDSLIVTIPTEPSLEAEQYTKGSGIPIVGLDASSEGTSLIISIQNPGHDFAGVRYPGPEDSVERLDILHQMAPQDNQILVPYLADYPNVPAQLTAMEAEAAILGQHLIIQPLAPAQISGYVAGLSPSKPGFDAIVGAAEPFTVTPALNGSLYAFANQNNIPILGGALSNDDTGPIVSVAPSSFAVGELASSLANKIFKGAKAGSLPVLTPTSNLEVNLKVAKRLGITPDTGLLSTATEIIR